MKPAPFEYVVPDSLTEVLELVAKHGEDAKLLAGGQSIVPAMNFRLTQPSLLVDLNRLDELNFITEGGNGVLKIGAMTRQRQLERDPLIKAKAPLLHETMPYIAHEQIRNRGTLGGSIAHADPASEIPVIITALSGRILFQSLRGQRWVSADDCFVGIFTTDIAPDEVLIEVEIPPLPDRTGWAFTEFARRQGDYALIGLAVVMTLDEGGVCQAAKVVYLNAGDLPVTAEVASLLMIGETPTDKLFKAVAEEAQLEINPTGDIHATEPYLRHLAKVLTLRALNSAYERIGA
jgi:carbon-monoxide dehydrogenase medium subunit